MTKRGFAGGRLRLLGAAAAIALIAVPVLAQTPMDDPDDARAAKRAGATFAVTPALGDGIREAHTLGLPVLAGVMTPTEILAARPLDVAALKIFPAAEAGGPAYLKALRGPFPYEAFVPVGGVDEAAARAYLDAGATAVGVGSPLAGDAADGGSLAALRARTRAFLAVVRNTSSAGEAS